MRWRKKETQQGVKLGSSDSYIHILVLSLLTFLEMVEGNRPVSRKALGMQLTWRQGWSTYLEYVLHSCLWRIAQDSHF